MPDRYKVTSGKDAVGRDVIKVEREPDVVEQAAGCFFLLVLLWGIIKGIVELVIEYPKAALTLFLLLIGGAAGVGLCSTVTGWIGAWQAQQAAEHATAVASVVNSVTSMARSDAEVYVADPEYAPVNANLKSIIDNDPSTSWAENMNQGPISFTLTLSNSGTLTWMGLELANINGDGKPPLESCSDDRPKDILLHFSDGSEQNAHFENVGGWQYVKLNPVHTASVRLGIKSSYSCSYGGVAIREVDFRGQPDKASLPFGFDVFPPWGAGDPRKGGPELAPSLTISVTAVSSEFNVIGQGYYPATYALDGNTETDWIAQEGVGAWLQLQLPAPRTITEISLFCVAPGDTYLKFRNPAAEPREITLTFSDGSVQVVSLLKVTGWQHFSLRPVLSSSVNLTVRNLYPGPGSDFQIAKIYEVQLHGKPHDCPMVPENSDMTIPVQCGKTGERLWFEGSGFKDGETVDVCFISPTGQETCSEELSKHNVRGTVQVEWIFGASDLRGTWKVTMKGQQTGHQPVGYFSELP